MSVYYGNSNESLKSLDESRSTGTPITVSSNGAAKASTGKSILQATIPPEALRLLPADFVKRHRVLPLEMRDGTVRIATAEPGNQRIIDDIRLLSGMEVEESAAPAEEIIEKIAECYQVTVEQMVENLVAGDKALTEGRNLHD